MEKRCAPSIEGFGVQTTSRTQRLYYYVLKKKEQEKAANFGHAPPLLQLGMEPSVNIFVMDQDGLNRNHLGQEFHPQTVMLLLSSGANGALKQATAHMRALLKQLHQRLQCSKKNKSQRNADSLILYRLERQEPRTLRLEDLEH